MYSNQVKAADKNITTPITVHHGYSFLYSYGQIFMVMVLWLYKEINLNLNLLMAR